MAENGEYNEQYDQTIKEIMNIRAEVNYTLELSGGKFTPLITTSMKSVVETVRNNDGSGYDNSCEAWAGKQNAPCNGHVGWLG